MQRDAGCKDATADNSLGTQEAATHAATLVQRRWQQSKLARDGRGNPRLSLEHSLELSLSLSLCLCLLSLSLSLFLSLSLSLTAWRFQLSQKNTKFPPPSPSLTSHLLHLTYRHTPRPPCHLHSYRTCHL